MLKKTHFSPLMVWVDTQRANRTRVWMQVRQRLVLRVDSRYRRRNGTESDCFGLLEYDVTDRRPLTSEISDLCADARYSAETQ